MRVGIVPVGIMDTDVGAHTVGDELRLHVVFDHPDILFKCKFNRQRHDDLTGKSADLCFLRFLYGVPQYRAVFPFRRRVSREKDALVFETAFAGIIVRETVIVIVDSGAARVGCRRNSGTAFSSCDRLCF